jgi:hypothetical protein
MRLTLTLAIFGGLAGCTSRTLPLPPPVVEGVSFSASGLVRLDGVAQEGASIGVINEATGQGVVFTSPAVDCGGSCPFDFEVAAEPGDHLRVWQFENMDNNIDVQVPDAP